MTQVISIRQAPKGWERDANYVYIGRRGRGFDGYFGNPVAIGRPCQVCQQTHRDGGSTLPCYRKYMEARLRADRQFAERVAELRGKILVCFCHPKPCHGHVLAHVTDSMGLRRTS